MLASKTTSRPGRHQQPLILTQFPESSKICIIACIDKYEKRTLLLRSHSIGNDKQFIISYAPLHNPISSATTARHIKTFIKLARIDTTVFNTHSMRSSSTSKAYNAGLIINDIQKAAGWSSSSTFTKHYKLPIQKNFGSAIINRLEMVSGCFQLYKLCRLLYETHM